jgi:hypothetical protein
MANHSKSTVQIKQVFEDLDNFRNFCREYGYRFNERDLYSQKSHSFRQFQRAVAGKPVKNQWDIDLAKFKEQEAPKARG